MSIVDFLASVPGFDSLEPESLEKVATSAHTETFAEGEYLIRRGDPGDSMHVIHRGNVRIPVFDPTGRIRVVAQLTKGDVVGEMALLTGERRNADVVANGDVESIVLDRGTVMPLLREHPPLSRFLTEILGQRLEQAGGIEQVGKYRLLGKLGEGATSKVYEALHPGLNRAVAVKMLGHHLVYDATFAERFLEEARTIAGLSHPNIVQVFDTEKAYATFFIVMEKLEGTDLMELLQERGRLEPDETADFTRQLASALAFAHSRGIVHRDVKPANAALDGDGTVKLMDFGIAQTVQQEGSGTAEGTPRYIAPESILGQPVDGRADIYSLGVMAFEMLTGRPLFKAETLKELLEAHVSRPPPAIKTLRPDVPDGLAAFVDGALAKRPTDRLHDWGRIQSMLEGGPIELTAQPHEKIVRVKYLPRDRRKVERAVAVFERSLRNLRDADVASVQLVGDAPEPTEEQLTADTSLSGWFQKVTGRGKDDKTGNFSSTRVQKPWEE
jgi:eukaryotic-like serine/threonine-protein kinase